MGTRRTTRAVPAERPGHVFYLTPGGATAGPVRVAVVDAIDELGQGRKSYARRAWLDAYESLSHADQAAPLGAEDLELLATSAYMLGRDDDYVSGLERAHHAYLNAGEAMRAVRCAFWLGMNLALRGEMGRATGWLGRAQRLVEREGDDCSSGAIC